MKSPSHATVVALGEDRVEVVFDRDLDRWPWLALPALDPLRLEKQLYHASLTALRAMALFEPDTQTALTGYSWALASDPGPATGAVIERAPASKGLGFSVTLVAANGAPVATMRGEGVAFAHRDFGAWRAATKAKALAAPRPAAFDRAPPAAVGLAPGGRSLVGRPQDVGGALVIPAWLTQADLYPQHPFHTGSGDHVNAGHLLDCALQAAHLVLEASSPRACVGGGAEFRRYVELEVPFGLRLASRAPHEGVEALTFDVVQLDRVVSRINVHL